MDRLFTLASYLQPAAIAPQPCVCIPDEKNGAHYVLWVAQYFHDCVYSSTERWAFYLGLATIAVWMVAQFPQIYETFRLKRIDGISAGLLVQWLSGDVLNLAGCILTGQFQTQTDNALYFQAMDVILISQYSYYRFFHQPPSHRSLSSSSSTSTHGSDGSLNNVIKNRDEDTEQRPLLGGPSATTTTARATYDSTAITSPLSATSPTSSGRSKHHRPRASLATRVSVVAAILFGAACLLAVTVWQLSRDESGGGDGAVIICDAPKPLQPWQVVVGTIASWGSGLLYFFSRIPQILQNERRRSVHGLSVTMFILAIIANTTYGFSILLRFPAIDDKFWKNTFPFLVGSMGTLVFDVIIMVQAVRYGAALPLEEEEDDVRSGEEEIGE